MEMNCSHLRMGTQISCQARWGVRNRSTMVEGRMDNVEVKLVKPLKACLSEKVCACSYVDLMMMDSGKRPLLFPQRSLKDTENIEQSS